MAKVPNATIVVKVFMMLKDRLEVVQTFEIYEEDQESRVGRNFIRELQKKYFKSPLIFSHMCA